MSKTQSAEVDPARIKQFAKGKYQVLSSSGKTSYVVTTDSCECLGFRFRKTCSHIKAVNELG